MLTNNSGRLLPLLCYKYSVNYTTQTTNARVRCYWQRYAFMVWSIVILSAFQSTTWVLLTRHIPHVEHCLFLSSERQHSTDAYFSYFVLNICLGLYPRRTHDFTKFSTLEKNLCKLHQEAIVLYCTSWQNASEFLLSLFLLFRFFSQYKTKFNAKYLRHFTNFDHA